MVLSRRSLIGALPLLAAHREAGGAATAVYGSTPLLVRNWTPARRPP